MWKTRSTLQNNEPRMGSELTFIGCNDSELTGNDRASSGAAETRKVCELFDNEIDRKNNEEENVHRRAASAEW